MPRPRPKRSLLHQINVIPFVDVTLVLLVIFMAAVPALLQGLHVELPWTKNVESVPRDADHVVVTIRKDGQILLEENSLSLKELAERVPALASGKQLYLRADRELAYADVISVLDVIKGCGIETIHLVTEPPPGPDVSSHGEGQ